MISVSFTSVSPGPCSWCGKEKDAVYDVAFSDQSFVGRLCKNDLLRAIGMKVNRNTPERTPAAATAAPTSPPSK